MNPIHEWYREKERKIRQYLLERLKDKGTFITF